MIRKILSFVSCLGLLGVASASAQKSFDVVETSIHGIQKALQDKTCTCEFVVKEYLHRIAVYDQSTHLNSIVTVNPLALETARSLDAEYARTG
ncbi:MAG TPA: hypothetical protein VN824_09450, partial [Puia sp.]|nr:hypothetical protein [Puia sp.]